MLLYITLRLAQTVWYFSLATHNQRNKSLSWRTKQGRAYLSITRSDEHHPVAAFTIRPKDPLDSNLFDAFGM